MSLCVCVLPEHRFQGLGVGQMSSKNTGTFLSGCSFEKAPASHPASPSSQGEMPSLLRIQGDRGGGVHEAHGARWDTLLLQGCLQPLCAWGLQGE